MSACLPEFKAKSAVRCRLHRHQAACHHPFFLLLCKSVADAHLVLEAWLRSHSVTQGLNKNRLLVSGLLESVVGARASGLRHGFAGFVMGSSWDASQW